MNCRFKNKVVVVTGATSGIGCTTSELFSKEGANVVLVGRDVESGKKTEQEIVAGGGKQFSFGVMLQKLKKFKTWSKWLLKLMPKSIFYLIMLV